MIDFYFQLRQQMIDTMQNSLKQVRQVLGFGVQEFSDIVGLTRQTVNNLENRKNKMSATQYVAICAVIDHCTKDRPELLQVLSTIFSSNVTVENSTVFSSIENGSLLKKWFLCFPDDSKITGIFHEESDVIKQEHFDGIANSYKIFLDETILCEEGFGDWLQQVSETMKENHNSFLVPLKVVENIQGKIVSSDPLVVEHSQRGLNLLMRMQRQDMVEIRGEKSDVNAISTFISVFAKFKCVNRLALLTQNGNLAKQILSLNNEDIGGFNILATKFDKEVGLLKWYDDTSDFDSGEILSGEVEEAEMTTDLDFALKGWETIE